jgi:spermidine/putrescine transport system permease protein
LLHIKGADKEVVKEVVKVKGAVKEAVKKLELFLILLPALTWLIIFFFLPLGIAGLYSLAERGVYGVEVFNFSLNNYLKFLDPLYLNLLLKSLRIAFISTLLCLFIGFPTAYYIARQKRRSQRYFLLVLLILPFWMNYLITTYAWMTILGREGVVNSILLSLGLINEPIGFLFNENAVILGLVYVYLPFMVLPLYASLEKIDPTLLEAAKDLGATELQSFLKITLPLSIPGLFAGSILVFIPSVGAFITPDLLGGSEGMMIGNLIQNQFLAARNWPFGSAVSFILLGIVLILILLYAKFIRLEV